ncbi:hypothetical protein HZH66_008382 [Vespula vulgaris]|uniref:Uncharacterized protein n=1 Tax=Vespula vulgaris TaxID=7454 RepID=A0A834JT83_VESVU|nr:hypothetical protein HZH66_008382 [Vespula vulgaris]
MVPREIEHMVLARANAASHTENQWIGTTSRERRARALPSLDLPTSSILTSCLSIMRLGSHCVTLLFENEALAPKKGAEFDGVSEAASSECINLERRKVLESGNVTP